MATHAHSTRTPLLPQSGNPQPLLGQGLGRQLGPVTRAIRACRETDLADQAIAEIQIGLDSFFADADRQRASIMRRPTWPLHAVRQVGDEQLHGIRALSRAEVENLVGSLIDLLDGWDGETDHEPDLDREHEAPDASATEWTGRGAHRFNVGRAA